MKNSLHQTAFLNAPESKRVFQTTVISVMFFTFDFFPHRPFDIDDDVQLVCKYLRAYKLRHDPVNGIDRVLPRTGTI